MSPFSTIPPPMPVPMVNPTTCFAPRAAPRHHSPNTAQLASLSSVPGRSSAPATRSRNGLLTQPRFGVSNTTPVFVLSGPGEPMPTPATSRPRPAAAIDARVSSTIRPTTASGPSSGFVGSDSTPRISDPSSATVPATMLVPPTSIPTMYRTGLLHGSQDVVYAHSLQAPMVPQRTRRGHVRQASPSSPTTTSCGPRGPNPNAGIVGPNIATVGVSTA